MVIKNEMIIHKDYDNQIKEYIEKQLKIKIMKLIAKKKEPFSSIHCTKKKNKINIGTAGGMTRLSNYIFEYPRAQ